MTFLLAMHARLLFTILLVFGALALWGLAGYLRGKGPSGGYMALLAIGELLMLAQFIIGVLLALNGRQAARPSLHIIYGVVAILVVPGAWRYIRGRDPRQQQIVYALTCLFLCGIALRALGTGR